MANKVKQLRTEQGIDLVTMAQKTGLSKQTIWSIETGRTKEDLLKWSTVKRITLALNKKIEEVFF